MSQSQQAASKKNDLMQTKKIFEDDIGEDFLSSWKPSVLKTDAGLDFGNDTPPKAKKNSFSLDKFDVDFDFDGGFGKFSTFNVDMSDLDFRSPSSKTQKSKSKIQENSQEEKKEAKGDSFKFEFDFKGLDGFDIDCTLLKGKEEHKIPEHENLSMVSGESIENEIAPNGKSKVLSKATNKNSKDSEDGTVLKRQTVPNSKFRLPALNMEEVESQEGFAPTCLEISGASGSRDIGTKPQKQTTAAKKNVVDTSYGNLVQTGGSSIMKEAFNPMESKHPDIVSSSKFSSLHSGSEEKVSLQNGSSTEDRLALKDSRRDQLQSLAEGIAPKCLEIACGTSGSWDIETKSQKQTTAAKQDVLDTSFGKLLQTGGSNTLKETFNPMESKDADNVLSSKTSSLHSVSGEKISLQNTSPMEERFALKDSRGEQQQSLAKTNPHHTEMPDSDSSTKNSNPMINECSQQSPDKCIAASSLKSFDTSIGKRIPSNRLSTVVQKDTDDNNKRHMSQCLNPEASGEYQHTPSKHPFPVIQREITTRKPVTTLKHKLYLKESIGDQTWKEERKAMTEVLASTQQTLERHSLSGENANVHQSPVPMRNIEGLCTKSSPDSIQKISSHDNNIPTARQKERESNGVTNSDEPGLGVDTDLQEMENSLENCTSTSKDASHVGKSNIVENISILSRSRENSLQGLNTIGHISSLTDHGNREALNRISSVSQSKPNHHAQKRILSEVSKITKLGERTGKHPLQGSSKLLINETKEATIMIPQKYPPNHPRLQVSRSMSKDVKSPTILKQTNKRLFSSSKATVKFSTNMSISKNIQGFTEQKNTASSPLPPLKRKPMEKFTAETISTKPLKQISSSPAMAESESIGNVRKIEIRPSIMKGRFPDMTYGKIHIEHSSPVTVSGNKLPNTKKITETVVEQENSKTDREFQVSSRNEHADQHFNSCSPSEMNARDSQDVSMIENDNIVEKAVTCSRDIEDMCKMLKKKHEEAKDLLVRAIVHNNLLLMLNHPLHEEKIQAIQKHVARMFPEGCRK